MLAQEPEGRRRPAAERSPTTAAPRDVRRVNVNFSGQAYDALDQLARESGETMSDVIREAIALKRWVHDTQKEGGRILVERDGKVRELVNF